MGSRARNAGVWILSSEGPCQVFRPGPDVIKFKF